MNKPALSIAAIFALCALQGASAAVPDPEFQARLEAGEVVALDVRGAQAGGERDEPRAGDWGAGARMQVLVRAPARAVWAVIVSCEHAFRFIAGLRHCEVLEDTGDRALVHQVVDQGWLMPRYDFVFESLRRPYEWIGVRLVEGNLERMEGAWRFEETAAGTLVEHELRMRPGSAVPRFLVRRNLEHNMPDLLACIRALANGSGSNQLRESDLARCQEPPAPPG